MRSGGAPTSGAQVPVPDAAVIATSTCASVPSWSPVRRSRIARQVASSMVLRGCSPTGDRLTQGPSASSSAWADAPGGKRRTRQRARSSDPPMDHVRPSSSTPSSTPMARRGGGRQADGWLRLGRKALLRCAWRAACPASVRTAQTVDRMRVGSTRAGSSTRSRSPRIPWMIAAARRNHGPASPAFAVRSPSSRCRASVGSPSTAWSTASRAPASRRTQLRSADPASRSSSLRATAARSVDRLRSASRSARSSARPSVSPSSRCSASRAVGGRSSAPSHRSHSTCSSWASVVVAGSRSSGRGASSVARAA